VVVGVSDNQPGWRQRQYCDVPTQLVPIEGSLMVDHVGHEGFTHQGGIQGIGYKIREVAASFDIGAQLQPKGRRVGHGAILSLSGGRDR
jgi:hypothetical protein